MAGQIESEFEKITTPKIKKDYYIHFSWDVYNKNDAESQKKCIEETKRMIEKNKDKAFVFISTLSKLDNEYVKAKREAEKVVAEMAKKFVIIRLPHIVGKGLTDRFLFDDAEPYGEMELLSINDAVLSIKNILESKEINKTIPVHGEIVSAKLYKSIISHSKRRLSEFRVSDQFNVQRKLWSHVDRVNELLTTGATRPVLIEVLPTNFCNAKCVHPDTLVTMVDFSQKPIKDLQEGEKILGIIHEKPNRTRLIEQKVLKKWYTEPKKCVIIKGNQELSNLICGEEHRIYSVRNHDYRFAKNLLKRNDQGKFLPKTYTFTKDYAYGYLIGAFYGDGWIKSPSLSFAVIDKEFATRVQYFIKYYFDYDIPIYQYRNAINSKKPYYDMRIRSKKIADALMHGKQTIFSQNNEIFRGFMAGLFDAEGTWSTEGGLSISQKASEELYFKKIMRQLSQFGFSSTIYYHKEKRINRQDTFVLKIGKRKSEALRFFLWAAPVLKRKNKPIFNNIQLEKETISATPHSYTGKLVEISTETENYFANGLLVHNCPWCFYKDTKDERMIKKETMLRALKDVVSFGVKAINWTGGGEPTIHPNFREFTEFAHKVGLKQGLFTNAIEPKQVNPELFSWIRISETNIGFFPELKKLIPQWTKHTKVGYNINLIPEHTEAYLRKVTRMVYEAGANYMQVRPALTRLVKDQFAVKYPYYLKDYERDNFKVHLSEHKFNDYLKSPEYTVCLGSWFCPSIDFNGKLVVCEYWLDNPKFELGDLNKKSFIDAWQNEKSINILKNLKDLSNCQHCCRNHEVNKLLFNLRIPNEDAEFL